MHSKINAKTIKDNFRQTNNKEADKAQKTMKIFLQVRSEELHVHRI